MNDEFQNMKQESEEDWTVSEPNLYPKQAVGTETIDEISPDAKTAPISADTKEDWVMDKSTAEIPPEKKQDKWEMPEPVFRVSSGKKLDKSNLVALPSNLQVSPPETSQMNAPNAIIQPQPYISEEFIVGDAGVIEKPSVKVKSKARRIIFIVVGILGMVLFAVAFLIGVYFLFFRQPEL